MSAIKSTLPKAAAPNKKIDKAAAAAEKENVELQQKIGELTMEMDRCKKEAENAAAESKKRAAASATAANKKNVELQKRNGELTKEVGKVKKEVEEIIKESNLLAESERTMREELEECKKCIERASLEARSFELRAKYAEKALENSEQKPNVISCLQKENNELRHKLVNLNIETTISKKEASEWKKQLEDEKNKNERLRLISESDEEVTVIQVVKRNGGNVKKNTDNNENKKEKFGDRKEEVDRLRKERDYWKNREERERRDHNAMNEETIKLRKESVEWKEKYLDAKQDLCVQMQKYDELLKENLKERPDLQDNANEEDMELETPPMQTSPAPETAGRLLDVQSDAARAHKVANIILRQQNDILTREMGRMKEKDYEAAPQLKKEIQKLTAQVMRLQNNNQLVSTEKKSERAEIIAKLVAAERDRDEVMRQRDLWKEVSKKLEVRWRSGQKPEQTSSSEESATPENEERLLYAQSDSVYAVERENVEQLQHKIDELTMEMVRIKVEGEEAVAKLKKENEWLSLKVKCLEFPEGQMDTNTNRSDTDMREKLVTANRENDEIGNEKDLLASRVQQTVNNLRDGGEWAEATRQRPAPLPMPPSHPPPPFFGPFPPPSNPFFRSSSSITRPSFRTLLRPFPERSLPVPLRDRTSCTQPEPSQET